jgi:succinoglycan biosynthesis protein ExoA
MTEVMSESRVPPAPPRPAVSVIAPMLNEASYIDHLVSDLAEQDIEEPFETIIADGGSTDGSVELLRAAAEQAGLDLLILDNPDRYQSHGLNRCIRAASGDVIVRLDCHTRYPADYVRRCVDSVRETGAANVAGVFTAIGRTPTERAVACALESPFGGHNWTRNATAGERVEVDTNYLGAFRKDALERVGMYDEDLIIGEVEDLNLTLRDAGETILLDPEIRSYYYPRGSYLALFRQYYRYGYWKVAVMDKHRRIISGRSVVPCVFVLSLVGLGLASVESRWARRLLAAEAVAYSAGAVGFGFAAARKCESMPLLPRVMAAFATFHVAHGSGMVHGAVDKLLSRHAAS